MSRDLLPDRENGRLHLVELQQARFCVATGTRHEPGEYAVQIGRVNPRATNVTSFIVAVDAVGQFVDRLERATFDGTVELGEWFTYEPADADVDWAATPKPCAVCNTDVDPGDCLAITMTGQRRYPTAHRECIPAFREALDRVWAHPEVVLPDVV